jgi:hypothetical protein
LLRYDDASFIYVPFPVSYIPGIFDPATYERLSTTFPAIELFEHKPDLGDKYSLAERNNSENYHAFLANSPAWNALYKHIKSEAFVRHVLEFLKINHIDLGLDGFKFSNKRHSSLWSRITRQSELGARFEFSAMGGNGGSILPHTDHPNKLVTLVLSMIAPDEWDQSWGGGTQMCIPNDRTKIYNQMNKYMTFNEVEVVAAYPFVPNQCIVFVKTYNSWHQVQPIYTPPGSAFRKTLTINIELLK